MYCSIFLKINKTYFSGLLVDLHSRGNAGLDSCGHLEPLGFQHIFAARWAAEVLNNQSTEGTLPPSRLPIGNISSNFFIYFS